jgi:hypothetical protein|tara:strand:+ start:122 stop:334 length:213 start_codon:yes stop_codon:yes gene_type:complete
MDKVTAEDFRELKEARIKGSLTARINALEKTVGELEELVDSVCDLLEAGNVVKFTSEKIVSIPDNYGGSK